MCFNCLFVFLTAPFYSGLHDAQTGNCRVSPQVQCSPKTQGTHCETVKLWTHCGTVQTEFFSGFENHTFVRYVGNAEIWIQKLWYPLSSRIETSQAAVVCIESRTCKLMKEQLLRVVTSFKSICTEEYTIGLQDVRTHSGNHKSVIWSIQIITYCLTMKK